MTYTLYGALVSLYTGKTRSYLRTQGIDFVEFAPGSDRFDVMAEIGLDAAVVEELVGSGVIVDGDPEETR